MPTTAVPAASVRRTLRGFRRGKPVQWNCPPPATVSRAWGSCWTSARTEPLLVPLWARISVAPSRRDVTNPVWSTEATVASSAAQTTVTPGIGSPYWSNTTAVTLMVSPMASKSRASGVRAMESARGGSGSGSGFPFPSPHAPRMFKSTMDTPGTIRRRWALVLGPDI